MNRLLAIIAALGILTPPYTTGLALFVDALCIAGLYYAFRRRKAV